MASGSGPTAAAPPCLPVPVPVRDERVRRNKWRLCSHPDPVPTNPVISLCPLPHPAIPQACILLPRAVPACCHLLGRFDLALSSLFSVSVSVFATATLRCCVDVLRFHPLPAHAQSWSITLFIIIMASLDFLLCLLPLPQRAPPNSTSSSFSLHPCRCRYRAAAGFGRSPPPTPTTDFTFLAARRPCLSATTKQRFLGHTIPRSYNKIRTTKHTASREERIKQRWSRRRRRRVPVPRRRRPRPTTRPTRYLPGQERQG